MNIQQILDFADDTARITPEEIGAAIKASALRLAPLVAATYAAGYATGELVHDLNAKLPRFLRFLGVAA